MKKRILVVLFAIALTHIVEIKADNIDSLTIFSARYDSLTQVCDGLITISETEIVIYDKNKGDTIHLTPIKDVRVYNRPNSGNDFDMKRYDVLMVTGNREEEASVLFTRPEKESDGFWEFSLYTDKKAEDNYSRLVCSYLVIFKEDIVE